MACHVSNLIIIHSTIINFLQLDEINLMNFLEQIKEIVLKFQLHPPSLKYKKLLPPSSIDPRVS